MITRRDFIAGLTAVAPAQAMAQVPGTFTFLPSTTTTLEVARSLRLRASNSAKLTRTLTTASSGTLSVWLKRGLLGTTTPIFGGGVYFTSADKLYAFGTTTTQVFRDLEAWMHLYASNNGLYINGTLISSLTTSSLTNPAIGYDGTNYADIYLAEFIWADGQTIPLSKFASTDANGEWSPLTPILTYGANGFYLPFSDNSSATNLGLDSSGNGNNWTSSGISVTAGVTNDSLVDTPTNYGTDTGAGGEVRGNYLTLSPLGNGTSAPGIGTLRNANLDCTLGVGGRVATAPIFGKGMAEVTWNGAAGARIFGISSDARNLNTSFGATITNFWGVDENSTAGVVVIHDGSTTNFGTIGVGSGGTWRLAWDATNPSSVLVWVGKGASTWYNSAGGTTGNPATGANPTFTITAGGNLYVTAAGDASSSDSVSVNFGQRPFSNTAPTGFKALCTQNLTDTTISLPASFTGNASADGPFLWANGEITAITINGNVATRGTDFDAIAGGIKLRTASTSYNASGSNTVTAYTAGTAFKYARAQTNP